MRDCLRADRVLHLRHAAALEHAGLAVTAALVICVHCDMAMKISLWGFVLPRLHGGSQPHLPPSSGTVASAVLTVRKDAKEKPGAGEDVSREEGSIEKGGTQSTSRGCRTHRDFAVIGTTASPTCSMPGGKGGCCGRVAGEELHDHGRW